MKPIVDSGNVQVQEEPSLAKKAGGAILPLIVMAIGAIIVVVAVLNGDYKPEIPGEQVTLFQEHRLLIWSFIGLSVMAIGYYVTPNNLEALRKKRDTKRLRKQQKAQQKAAQG